MFTADFLFVTYTYSPTLECNISPHAQLHCCCWDTWPLSLWVNNNYWEICWLKVTVKTVTVAENYND